MVAVPVLRSRVAPVLNWCSRIVVFRPGEPGDKQKKELVFEDMDVFKRLQSIREMGVDTLICGAVSRDLLFYAHGLGFQIICGIAGEIDDVIEAYCRNRLDESRFRLPGCCGMRRYRERFLARRSQAGRDNKTEVQVMPRGGGGPGKGQGRGPGGATGARKGRGQGCGMRGSKASGTGPQSGSAECVCPACGERIAHQRGIPCNQTKCPKCGQVMSRE